MITVNLIRIMARWILIKARDSLRGRQERGKAKRYGKK
jgi:hypothetical protein